MRKFLVYAVVALFALFVGVGIGGSSEASARNVSVEATPSVEPTPTPTIAPTPTPEVIVEEVEVEIEVTPQVCRDAILSADALIGDTTDMVMSILSAYVDYPDEDLGAFGTRVETVLLDAVDADTIAGEWEKYNRLADACLSAD